MHQFELITCKMLHSERASLVQRNTSFLFGKIGWKIGMAKMFLSEQGPMRRESQRGAGRSQTQTHLSSIFAIFFPVQIANLLELVHFGMHQNRGSDFAKPSKRQFSLDKLQFTVVNNGKSRAKMHGRCDRSVLTQIGEAKAAILLFLLLWSASRSKRGFKAEVGSGFGLPVSLTEWSAASKAVSRGLEFGFCFHCVDIPLG